MLRLVSPIHENHGQRKFLRLGLDKRLADATGLPVRVADDPAHATIMRRCLFSGEGCKKNEQEAVSWYRKAAEQGEASTMFNLGACYMEGTGVKKDVTEATKWFKKAASLGHERSAKIGEKLQKDGR